MHACPTPSHAGGPNPSARHLDRTEPPGAERPLEPCLSKSRRRARGLSQGRQRQKLGTPDPSRTGEGPSCRQGRLGPTGGDRLTLLYPTFGRLALLANVRRDDFFAHREFGFPPGPRGLAGPCPGWTGRLALLPGVRTPLGPVSSRCWSVKKMS